MKSELLIPVGNYDCLVAAINNGCDAVYLGGKKFGARAYANNFDSEEMIKAIKLCHLYGVKIYVTVNTMCYNDEIEEVIEYIKFLHINKVDALIMQDIGLINLTRKLFPDLEIHVSTQAHNHNKEGIKYFYDLGCKRVVFDRESSLNSINNIDIPIEKEVFIYGALCISYSGNCLFSALNGGRSANRGMCVGSCRLPYTLYKNKEKIDSGYLLSTKDLNTTNKLKEILDSNITSLKVEGRMKSKEYVAIVTRIYRKLIDNYYNNEPMVITEEDKYNLLVVFNREYTKGYLFDEENIINKKTSNHQGVNIGKVIAVNNKYITILLNKDLNQGDAIRFNNINEGMYVNLLYDNKGLLTNKVEKNNTCMIDNKNRIMYDKLINSEVLKTIDIKLNESLDIPLNRKINITMNYKAKLNNNMELSISDGKNTINLKGNITQKAINQPTTKERIEEQLTKLGQTIYNVEKLNIDIDDNIFINIKDINELRREATNKLDELRSNIIPEYISYTLPNIVKNITNNKKISILTRNEEQLNIAIRNNIDYIYTTNKELYNKYKTNHKNIYLRLERVNNLEEEYNNENLLCTEIGSIYKYKNNNNIRSDYYLNIANDYSIKYLLDQNIKSTCLSIELEIEKLNKIKNKTNSEIIVYGNIECMIIKNNIFNINNEETYLVNEKGFKYPCIYDGYTHIFNYTKHNIINKLDRLENFGTYRIELLDEDIATTQKIINELKEKINY